MRRVSRRCLLREATAVGVAMGAVVAGGGSVLAGGKEARVRRAAASPITLTHWDWWAPSSPQLIAYWKWISETWASHNPHIKLQVEFVPFSDYVTKVLAAAAAGTLPDVMHTSVAWAGQFWSQGILEQLDSYIAHDRTVQRQEFVPAAWLYNHAGPKTFGLPIDGPDSDAILYNLDMVKAAKLPTEPVELLGTWEKWQAAAERLTVRENGRVKRAGYLVPMPGTEIFASLLYSNGGQFYGPGAKSLAVDNPKAVAALEFQQELLYGGHGKAPVSFGLSANENVQTIFTAGQAAMVWNGTWAANSLVAKFNWQMAAIPQGPSGRWPSQCSWSNMVCMLRSTPHPEAAWTLASFFAGPLVGENKLRILHYYSPRLDVLQSAVWKAAVRQYPFLAQVPIIAEHGQQYPDVQHTAVALKVDPILQDIMLRRVSIKAGLQQIEAAGNAVLAQGGAVAG